MIRSLVMCNDRKFEELQITGRKVGEEPQEVREGGMHDVDHPDEFDDDSKCGPEEEGQSHHEDEESGEDEEKVSGRK